MSMSAKATRRKLREVKEFEAIYTDFTSNTVYSDGKLTQELVCRFCYQEVNSKRRKVMEHLQSDRHKMLKEQAALKEIQQQLLQDEISVELSEPIPSGFQFQEMRPIQHVAENNHGSSHCHYQKRDSELKRENRKLTMPDSEFPNNIQIQKVWSTQPAYHEMLHSQQETAPFVSCGGFGPSDRIRCNTSSKGSGSTFSTRDSGIDTGCSNSPPSSSNSKEDFSSEQETFCIKRENFQSEMLSWFSKQFYQQQFVDITLCCEGKSIKCHKLVVIACSPLLERMLTNAVTGSSDQTIFLVNVSFWEIEAILELIYKGEVNVPKQKFQAFLKAIKFFEIQGIELPPTANNDDATKDRRFNKNQTQFGRSSHTPDDNSINMNQKESSESYSYGYGNNSSSSSHPVPAFPQSNGLSASRSPANIQDNGCGSGSIMQGHESLLSAGSFHYENNGGTQNHGNLSGSLSRSSNRRKLSNPRQIIPIAARNRLSPAENPANIPVVLLDSDPEDQDPYNV